MVLSADAMVALKIRSSAIQARTTYVAPESIYQPEYWLQGSTRGVKDEKRDARWVRLGGESEGHGVFGVIRFVSSVLRAKRNDWRPGRSQNNHFLSDER